MGWLGAVLAGGESRRFGSDKAAAQLGGKSLVERAAETLAEVFPEVVVISARAPTTEAWRHVPDARAGQGPLAGIETALRFATERGLEGAFVLACDLPLVRVETVSAVLSALGDRLAAAPARALTPQGDQGWEPLCAAYRVECLARVSSALDRGDLAAHALLDGLGAARLVVPAEVFLNVNTPRDHTRAEAVLEDGDG